MKKLAVILACGVCVFGLVACGGSSNTSSSSSSNSNTADTQTASESYVFTYNDVDLSIGMEIDDVEGELGEATQVNTASSCAGAGEDSNYVYSGFMLTTYTENGGKPYITNITLQDDTLETAEGIKLGASADDVTAAYGDDYSDSNGNYVYTKGDMTLSFVMTDGKVTSIQYEEAN